MKLPLQRLKQCEGKKKQQSKIKEEIYLDGWNESQPVKNHQQCQKNSQFPKS
jgi:hypothetical protein